MRPSELINIAHSDGTPNESTPWLRTLRKRDLLLSPQDPDLHVPHALINSPNNARAQSSTDPTCRAPILQVPYTQQVAQAAQKVCGRLAFAEGLRKVGVRRRFAEGWRSLPPWPAGVHTKGCAPATSASNSMLLCGLMPGKPAGRPSRKANWWYEPPAYTVTTGNGDGSLLPPMWVSRHQPSHLF